MKKIVLMVTMIGFITAVFAETTHCSEYDQNSVGFGKMIFRNNPTIYRSDEARKAGLSVYTEDLRSNMDAFVKSVSKAKCLVELDFIPKCVDNREEFTKNILSKTDIDAEDFYNAELIKCNPELQEIQVVKKIEEKNWCQDPTVKRLAQEIIYDEQASGVLEGGTYNKDRNICVYRGNITNVHGKKTNVIPLFYVKVNGNIVNVEAENNFFNSFKYYEKRSAIDEIANQIAKKEVQELFGRDKTSNLNVK